MTRSTDRPPDSELNEWRGGGAAGPWERGRSEGGGSSGGDGDGGKRERENVGVGTYHQFESGFQGEDDDKSKVDLIDHSPDQFTLL